MVAILAIIYTATRLVGMAIFGIESWTRNADTFGVYFNLFSKLSPWARRDGQLVVRRPGIGLRGLTDTSHVTGRISSVPRPSGRRFSTAIFWRTSSL